FFSLDFSFFLFLHLPCFSRSFFFLFLKLYSCKLLLVDYFVFFLAEGFSLFRKLYSCKLLLVGYF
ncbi:hypothetical protein C0J52_21144, partial [Blattella germanica]